MKSKPQPTQPNIKIAAILLAFIAVFVQHANAQTEAQIPGDIRIARWDVIFNDNGLESVDSIDSRSVKTDSKLYQAAIFKADDLRQAVIAATGAGGLEGGSQSMAYTQIFGPGNYNMQPLYFNYFQGPTIHVGMQGNANGTETYGDVEGGHIRVFLDYQQFNAQLFENNNGRRNTTSLNNKASIAYDGQLSPGDALVFSAAIKTKADTSYRHMIVWEAFKADQRYQQNFQMMQDSQRWCQLGPQGIRNYADIALVWAAGAKHPESVVAPKWEQTLQDGKTVRLVGITRTDKWLYCWWDADGLPVATNGWVQLGKYYQNEPLWFSAQVTGPPEEWKMQNPSGHPGPNRGQPGGPFNTSMATVVDQAGQAAIGVPVGPWEQVGEIKKGGSIKVDGTTYILRDIGGNGDNFMYAQFYSQQRNPADDETVTLSAVGLDGTEIDTDYVPQITGKNYGVPQPNFQGMAVKNLKLFHVWKRKIQWVTFTNFATEPTTPPKDQVTPAEVAAVVGAQQNQQQQVQNQVVVQQMASLKDKRKEWDAIPADPTTPKGALRALFQSAAKGDLTAVRARMKSSHAGSDPMQDITARFITANQSARATAIARFGQDKVQDLQVVSNGPEQLPGLMDLEMQMVGIPWQPRPDGGLTADQVAVIKGDDGTYYLDVSPATESVNGVQQSQAATTTMLLSMAQRMEQINQLLNDNPSLTIDQLRHALSNPTTQPATTHPS